MHAPTMQLWWGPPRAWQVNVAHQASSSGACLYIPCAALIMDATVRSPCMHACTHATHMHASG